MDNIELPKEIQDKIMNKIGATIVRDAIKRCPVDNGELRQKIDYDVSGNTITISVNSEYAEYIEWGTGIYHLDEDGNVDPHSGWDIVPKNAKALKFEVGRKSRLAAKKGPGQANIVFAKKVHIDGARAQPFVRPAIHQNYNKFAEIIVEGIKEWQQ